MKTFFVCVTLYSFTKLWVLWRLPLDRRGAELTSLTPYACQAPMSKVTPITNGGFHFFDWTQVFWLQSLCSLLVSVFLLIENQLWNKCSLSVALHLVKKKRSSTLCQECGRHWGCPLTNERPQCLASLSSVWLGDGPMSQVGFPQKQTFRQGFENK